MARGPRSHIRPSRRRAAFTAVLGSGLLVLAGCTGSSGDRSLFRGSYVPLGSGAYPTGPTSTPPGPTSTAPTARSSASSKAAPSKAAPSRAAPSTAPSTSAEAGGTFTMSFAGDVHFEDRVGTRLAADPATVFGQARPGLAKADLTMVNLETAITTGGTKQNKEFTFRAPPLAFTALKDAGVDIATMANNHGADYGAGGLDDTLTAIKSSGFPVVGIGSDATQAYAPYTTTVNGVKIAVLAASQVQDETLANWTAGSDSPGIASAYSPRFLAAVRAAKVAGYVVIVYVHWGIEYTSCPDNAQETLAKQLDQAGASAVIGTHVHELQGAGWRPDGTYVAYSLGNYLWWMSFGNVQDDNGVLTLTFTGSKVTAAHFAPSHLDDRGVPVPSTGAQATRILKQWNDDRSCTNVAGTPPK